MREHTKRVAALSSEQRELLVQRLRHSKRTFSASDIQPRDRDRDNFPLSFAQQRLWLLDQLEPGNPAYNIQIPLRIKGPLNRQALQQGLREIINRHEVLRTTFAMVDGQPMQVIAKAGSVELREVDVSGRSAAEREREVRRVAEEEGRHRFDLSRGPLLRATLLKLDEREHVLFLVMHHIVCDGWFSMIFMREMTTLYEAYVSGRSSPLPALPIQYADYALWQRQWLSGKNLEKQLGYWKRQLADVPVLQLPTDRARPAVQTFNGASRSIRLSGSLTEGLKALGQGEGATLFMVLLAAFQVLLYRYSGQDDIVVGSPIANRNRVEIEGLIGFFVNSLVLRTDLSGDPSFIELLGRVREMALAAYDHQDLPFEKLVEELQPQRDLSQNPLIAVIFALRNAPAEALAFSGLTLSVMELEVSTTRFDLEVHLWEGPAGLRGVLVYNTDLFDEDTIERLLGHFELLLEGIVADPRAAISRLPLITQAERQQLRAWNATARDYPHDRCIHELFSSQAACTPDAQALVYGDQSLSYAELERRSNQLGHYLRARGVGPEVLVGLCVERSVDMVVGMLGILKAGGAYVPLDPEYPAERLRFMLADTRAPVLLTQASLVDGLPQQDAEVVCLDRDWAQIARRPGSGPEPSASADNLAYVIYTSGSTGTPKGVAVQHKSIIRLLFGQDYVRLGADQTVLQMAPISFDASTFELWGALLHGGRCVLFPRQVPDIETLRVSLDKHGINTMWLTASLFNLIIDEAPEILSKVEQLLIGGEALSVDHVRRGVQLLPDTQISNGYGPTESTTFTCCYRIPEQVGPLLLTIPIGRPIGNTRVYILDDQVQPVPVGVRGELYIGGDGLARGYVNRPELTAESFIPDPFGDEPGGRLYKTGDMVRYLPDGNIEFLGRIDHQVKLRGYRIELEEIEAVLARHPAVRDNVVVVREDAPGEKQLVAYVVAAGEPQSTGSELRCFLEDKLPEYMVPSAVVYLDNMPLSPTGKVDRGALPAIENMRAGLDVALVMPKTALEREIAEIWQEALHLGRVGIHDNFFDLGGHSLLIAKIHERLRKRLQENISMIDMFKHPTINALAMYLGQRESMQVRENQTKDWSEQVSKRKSRLKAVHRYSQK